MFKYIYLIIIVIFSNNIYANNIYNKQNNEEKVSNDFKSWINKRLDEYEVWREKYVNEMDAKMEGQINDWGSSELSNNLKTVEFIDNNKIRKIVNYNNNTAQISVLVDHNSNEKDAKNILLRNKLSNNYSFNKKNIVVSTQYVNYSSKDQQKEKDFILNQVKQQMNEYDRQGEYLILSDTGLPDSFIYERVYQKKLNLLREAKIRISKINKIYIRERKSNKVHEEKKIITYKIMLPKNKLLERAKKYKNLVLKESQNWRIEPSLIMAIIHTESAFRPRAKSNVPAYGLMQIVPSSAGRDVNKFIHNIDAPMREEDLYNPNVNVEAGTAYLHILNNRYLNRITDPNSRLYCMISAYNTGAGNIARVFNKDRSTNINKAFPIINNMSSDEVYRMLMKKLPYVETKNYLKNVYSRMSLYK